MTVPTIVFADIDHVPLAIDGSHRRLPALLTALAAERITIVFCSSRTRAAVEGFRQSVGIFHPFICETGSVAFVPGRYFGGEPAGTRAVAGYEALEFGLPYATIVELLHRTAEQLRVGIRGFSDMSIEQVARECGISLLDARLAKLCEYGEPFRLLREDPVAERRLIRTLESLGLTCVRRGPFVHAVSVAGAGPAVDALKQRYRSTFGTIVTALAGRTGDATIPPLVDVTLDSGFGAAAGETLDWIEDIVERVRRASWTNSSLSGPEIQAFPDGMAGHGTLGFSGARDC